LTFDLRPFAGHQYIAWLKRASLCVTSVIPKRIIGVN
jgi:hypothetical protein